MKHSKKMLQVFRVDKTRTTFHLLLYKLIEDFHCELIHEVQALQTVADLYQQKDNLRLNGTAGSQQVLKS